MSDMRIEVLQRMFSQYDIAMGGGHHFINESNAKAWAGEISETGGGDIFGFNSDFRIHIT